MPNSNYRTIMSYVKCNLFLSLDVWIRQLHIDVIRYDSDSAHHVRVNMFSENTDMNVHDTKFGDNANDNSR